MPVAHTLFVLVFLADPFTADGMRRKSARSKLGETWPWDNSGKNSGQTFQAKMKAVNQEEPNFPAPHNDVHIGAAISGGGSRALAFTMGVLRALDGLGLMSRVDAISSVSGGSWAVGAYMFADMSEKSLLGQFTEPKELTLKALETRDGALTDAVNSSTKLRLAAYTAAYPFHEVWERLVSKTILSPFGLGDLDLYIAASSSHVSKICAANPQLSPNQFITPRPNRPKVFVMGGAVAAPPSYENDMGKWYGLQISADYTGSPFWPDYDGSLHPVNYKSKDDNSQIQNVVQGGGFIESFAFGGGAPEGEQAQSGSNTVVVAPPPRPLSLSTAVGISSAVAAYIHRNLWPVLPKGAAKQSGIEQEFADGGLIENSGHIALLQRGVTRVVSVFSTGIPMNPDVDFCGFRTEAMWEKLLLGCEHVECAMTSLFGYRYNSSTYFFDHNQVFDRADLPPLLCALQTLRQSGKPAVSLATLRLQKNTWWGIQGGYDVKLLVVYNEVCTDFEQSLPSGTQTALKKDKRFERHPHYSTSENTDPMYLKLPTANLLGAQAEYSVRQNADLFRQFLS